MSNYFIKNVMIIDGSGKPRYKGHVFIKEGKIESIYQEKDMILHMEDSELSDYTIIDGQNNILSPGFIDTHSHSDLAIITEEVLEPKIRQGITTEILGQDGIAMAPLPIEYIDDWQRNIAGLDGYSDKIDWKYKTIDGYIETIKESGVSINYNTLIPHGNLRLEAMGFSDEIPTDKQLDHMKDIVRKGMISGCLGLSSGLIYIPCAYAKIDELIELCKIVKEYDGVFVVHQRSEAGNILKSMDEIIKIGHESGVRIHFSHFKICGKRNWKYFDKVLKKLDHGKGLGVNISFDMYPYTAGSTMLSAILPPWMHVGGTYDMLKRLKDYAVRRMLRQELKKNRTKWDNFVSFAGTNGIYITSVATEGNQKFIGKNLNELGEYKGEKPLNAAFDLLIEEKNEVGMIDYYGYEEHIKAFVQREEMNACTDGLLGGKPHPRAYGAFPRFINEFVNVEKIVSLEMMIYKLTHKPAQVFNIKKRGLIEEGYYGDLIIFEEHKFKDLGDYLDPCQYPSGLKMVMVNGEIVFDGKVCIATNSGSFA